MKASRLVEGTAKQCIYSCHYVVLLVLPAIVGSLECHIMRFVGIFTYIWMFLLWRHYNNSSCILLYTVRYFGILFP
jgi:hypothetical protein